MIPAVVLVGGGQGECDIKPERFTGSDLAVRTIILRRQSPGLRPSTEVGRRGSRERLTTGPWDSSCEGVGSKNHFPWGGLERAIPKALRCS